VRITGLTLKAVNDMRTRPTALMTGQNQWFPFFLNCFVAPSGWAIMWQVLGWVKSKPQLVITGTLGFVMIPASSDASTASAVSAEANIVQRSSARAMLLSKLAAEKDLALSSKKALDLQ